MILWINEGKKDIYFVTFMIILKILKLGRESNNNDNIFWDSFKNIKHFWKFLYSYSAINNGLLCA